jgi:hypothetical protein
MPPTIAVGQAGGAQQTSPQASRSSQGPGGDWPHTTRVLPWMIALFLAMLWLTPIDVTTLPVSLPFDSTVIRFALVGVAFAWLLTMGTPLSPQWRRTPINLAILAFLGIALFSILVNLTDLARQEELTLAIKKLALLASYATFYLIVATTVRRSELSKYIILILVLASIAALGTAIEYRTNINYFYQWTAHLPFVQLGPEPVDPKFGRPAIVGPTQHGLAIAAILAMVMPFAFVGVMQARERSKKIFYSIVLALLVAGAVATLRKTALVVPVAGCLVLLLYRPRQMFRLIPLGLVLIGMTHFISPGALSGIRYQFSGGDKKSNEGRTEDYGAISPDIVSHPLLGRGYGTYDPKVQKEKLHPTEKHRILDNEFLLLVIEVSFLGLAAYLAIAGFGITTLHRIARSRDPRAGPALALIASIVAFVAANFTFDALSFRQVPYLFFCFLAFAVVLAIEPTSATRTRHELQRR